MKNIHSHVIACKRTKDSYLFILSIFTRDKKQNIHTKYLIYTRKKKNNLIIHHIFHYDFFSPFIWVIQTNKKKEMKLAMINKKKNI